MLLATGVVVMHAVLGLAPASSTSLAGSPASTSATPAAITQTVTETVTRTGPETVTQTIGSTSMSTSGVSSGVAAAQVSPDAGHGGPADPSGHDCVHCQGADHAMSLGHLCLAVVGGLLLAGAAAWGRRRHRLPVLDLDVRRSEQGLRPPARAVLGVPPWSHLSLAQLSLLRV
ncbi:hypothetical protein EDC03_0164 [Pseudokineococcus lusitanus]|uniref:MYXO-CTERM domain-containing protein n=2 Tax=Pseudokineococcus lusitanus TaxID=763993 RepID=A0A3N1HT12_9ACTN|nr:hypothetical protein EDC03_0164 [Pseudokineococcus lusitanus]